MTETNPVWVLTRSLHVPVLAGSKASGLTYDPRVFYFLFRKKSQL